MSLADRFARLPTGAKLLLILTAILLPIGIALTLVGSSGIREANAALEGRSQDQGRAAAQAIDSLVARNALALRIAASGALAEGSQGACDRARNSLAAAPAIAQSFELEGPDGKPLCSQGDVGSTVASPSSHRGRSACGSRQTWMRLRSGMASKVEWPPSQFLFRS